MRVCKRCVLVWVCVCRLQEERDHGRTTRGRPSLRCHGYAVYICCGRAEETQSRSKTGACVAGVHCAVHCGRCELCGGVRWRAQRSAVRGCSVLCKQTVQWCVGALGAVGLSPWTVSVHTISVAFLGVHFFVGTRTVHFPWAKIPSCRHAMSADIPADIPVNIPWDSPGTSGLLAGPGIRRPLLAGSCA